MGVRPQPYDHAAPRHAWHVNRIQIYGGNPANAIPGGIDGVTVEIGGVAIVFATTPFGVLNALGVPVNDEIDLSGSALAGVLTDLIVLRDFTGALAFASAISITEITVARCRNRRRLALLAVGFAAFATTSPLGEEQTETGTDMLHGSCHCGSVKWRFEGCPNPRRRAIARYVAATVCFGPMT